MNAGTNHWRWVPRVLAVIGVACALWSAAIWLSTGFELALGPLSVRAHRLDRSTTLAVIALALAWLVDVRVNQRNIPGAWLKWAGRLLGAAARQLLGLIRTAIAHRPSARVSALLVLVAVALVAAGASVSTWRAAPPFWLDEETIAINIRDRGFTQLSGALWFGQSAPLGWLIVQHAILRMFGAGELVLRFVPLAFGLATIGVALWIARRWLRVAAGLVLVVLCGFGMWLEHYRFEVKHYTADGFFALLLPALVVWALEGASASHRLRRAAVWWVIGGVGLWLANGAALVAPTSALLLVFVIWRRDGFAASAKVAAIGIVWLAAFAAHYELSMRATLQSQYLRDFWASQPATATLTLADRLRTFVSALRELASNPGGTSAWLTLWVSATLGFLLGRRRLLAIAFGAVPIAAYLLATIDLVPLRERLALWIAPAMYVGVALAVDRVEDIAHAALRTRRWVLLAAALALALLVAPLVTDVVAESRKELAGSSWNDMKQGVNDRTVVRWLARQLRPGDAVVTTHHGWPALWWYGGRAGELGPGIESYELSMSDDCPSDALARELKRHARVFVYLGFRDIPAGFDTVVMRRLADLAPLVDYRTIGDSWAAFVDFNVTGSERVFQPPPTATPPSPDLSSRCFSVSPAKVW